MEFRHKVIINAPIEEVYGSFFYIKEWPNLIPHVTEIKEIACDSIKQHIYMNVLGKKKIETMETVRYVKKKDIIKFHQISMPKPLKKHDGEWKFRKDGEKTIVESIHWIETDIPIIGKLAERIAWRFFIKRNSEMTFRAIKLYHEYRKEGKIVPDSYYLKHEIDINMPLNEAYKKIGNPSVWPEFYPTAISIDIIRDTNKLCEFKLVEYVGNKKFYSHSYLHKDPQNMQLYYQHYPPAFPLKYMILIWKFQKIDEKHTKFIIHREYDIAIPVIGNILRKTIAKKIINSHVADYHRDLLKFVEKSKREGGAEDEES